MENIFVFSLNVIIGAKNIHCGIMYVFDAPHYCTLYILHNESERFLSNICICHYDYDNMINGIRKLRPLKTDQQKYNNSEQDPRVC